MRIITRTGAKKIAQDLSIILKNAFKSKGINLKEKEILKIENDFFLKLGGKRKNERKN